MKKFQDFFYDKNDILIALLILCFAALIIMWRIDVIMDYPQTLAKETDTLQTTEQSAVETPQDTDKEDAPADENTASDAESDQVWMAGELTQDVSISIAGGSASAAVDGLVTAGLFESYDEFASVCKAAGRDPEGIIAGTFTFEKGSTQTDIAKEVTN